MVCFDFVTILKLFSNYEINQLTHPLYPQAHIVHLVRLPLTSALPDFSAPLLHRLLFNALLEDFALKALFPPPPVLPVPTPPPPNNSPSPLVFHALHAHLGGSRWRCVTPRRIVSVPHVPTSPSALPSSLPVWPVRGCVTADIMVICVRPVWPGSGASLALPIDALLIVHPQHFPSRRMRACARLVTRHKALLRVQALVLCVRQGPCVQGLESSPLKSNQPLFPTSPLSSCSYNSHCRCRRIWSHFSSAFLPLLLQ